MSGLTAANLVVARLGQGAQAEVLEVVGGPWLRTSHSGFLFSRGLFRCMKEGMSRFQLAGVQAGCSAWRLNGQKAAGCLRAMMRMGQEALTK